MPKKEIEPWNHLNSCTPASIRRIAKLMMSMEVDEDCKVIKPSWGATGYAIGKELVAFAEYKEGKTIKKNKKKQATEEKKGEDPKYKSSVRIIDTFNKIFKEHRGAPPLTINYGWCISMTRKLLKDGWSESEMIKMVSHYIKCGDDVSKFSNSRIFGRGCYRSFASALSLIQSDMKSKDGSGFSKTPRIPQSVKGAS